MSMGRLARIMKPVIANLPFLTAATELVRPPRFSLFDSSERRRCGGSGWRAAFQVNA